MALRKGILLKPCGENVLCENRHHKEGRWVRILVFRKDDYSKISVNESLVKALVFKFSGGWKLKSVGETKEFKRRIDAETEAVRLIVVKIYDVWNEEDKEFIYAKWEKGEKGYVKKLGKRKLELREQIIDGEVFSYKLYVDGKEAAGPLETGKRGLKRADKIYLWDRVFEGIGKIDEEWEFEEWLAEEKRK